MCINIGFPDASAERELLKGEDRKQLLLETPVILNTEQLISAQNEVRSVTVSDALYDYLQKLLEFSRLSNDFSNGLSPRAGLAILHSAQAWAFLHHRDHVLPEDVQHVLPYVIGHRLFLNKHTAGKAESESVSDHLISQVPIP